MASWSATRSSPPWKSSRRLRAPVREGVFVTRVEPLPEGGFLVRTRAGDLSSRAVACWPPAPSSGRSGRRSPRPCPPACRACDVDAYRNEGALPPGEVLVVGSGQSGAQICEELCQAGREVVLACGKAAWVPRRWAVGTSSGGLTRSGFFDQTRREPPHPGRAPDPQPHGTGHDGGHDLHLRTLKAMGVTLAGHFLGDGERSGPLRAGPAGERRLGGSALPRAHGSDRALRGGTGNRSAAGCPSRSPFVDRGPEWLDLSGFGVVIFAGGFRPGYRSWLPVAPGVRRSRLPAPARRRQHGRPGLFFVGVHFMRTRKSSLLFGVGEDAGLVSGRIGDFLRSGESRG